MHLRRVDAKSEAVVGLDIGAFRTIGRYDLRLDDLMIVSRQHVELQLKAGKSNEVIVRATPQCDQVLREGKQSSGTVLSKGGTDAAGDLAPWRSP